MRRGFKTKIPFLKKFFIPLLPVAYAPGSVKKFTNFRIKRAGSPYLWRGILVNWLIRELVN
jgi:hypothetical protein